MPAEVAHHPPPLPSPLPPGAAASPLPPSTAQDLGICANCGTPLRGPFCSQCGQHVRDLHHSVWRFVSDFFANVFSWDSKVLLTLEPLLARPGALTLDYLAGRRARYVHPLRLFLFTSAICLAIIQFVGSGHFSIHSEGKSSAKKHQSQSQHAAPAGSSPTPGPSAGGDWNFSFDSPPPVPTPADEDASPSAAPAAPAAPAAASPGDSTPRAEAKAPRSGQDPEDDMKSAVEEIRRTAAAAKSDTARQREDRVKTVDLQRRVSWVALVLLPIFAVMLRSLYRRQDRFYFAHFVFSLHYHTFLLLFAAAYMVLQWVLPTSFWPIYAMLRLALLLPGVYLFLALRRLYGESDRRTFVKVCVLGIMHVSILLLGLTIASGIVG